MANRWHVFSADHEIPGQLMVDFKNAALADEIMPFFEKHGLAEIDPARWYPMQDLLDIYNDMVAEGGAMFNFVNIGMKSSEEAIIPPDFAALPLPVILKGSEQVFLLNNRGTDFGSVAVEQITDKHIKVTMRVPAPDDLWYGVYYGYVKRFSPPGTHFTVYYDPEIPHRDIGGEKTILHITWD